VPERPEALRAATDAVSEAILVVDEGGMVSLANPAAQEMLGFSEGELLGRGLRDLVRHRRADVFLTGEPLRDREDLFERRDGTIVNVRCSSAPILREGRVAGAVLVVHDVGRRRRTEEALRETEAKLLALYESGVVGVASGEGDVILEANDAFLAMLGYDREALLEGGINWREITPPEELYRDEAVLRHARRHGYIEAYEKEYIARDGRRVAVILGGRYDLAYDPPRFVCFFLDVSSRRRTERALRESEERYRSLVEATASVVWRAAGDGYILDAPLWTEFTGQTEEEYRGWGWADVVHPEDRERTTSVWRTSLLERTPVYVEFRIESREEGHRWVVARGVPIMEPGESGGGAVREWVGTVTDIHARKLAEQERERLLRREREVSLTLQRALLPPTLPEIPDASVVARYVASGEGLRVGGDFYDAFSIPHDGFALVVGDVSGKGPEAAGLTSLAHYTIRAAAALKPDPEAVLGALNMEILRQAGGSHFFSLVYAELVSGQGPNGERRLKVASGGHPPPLVVRAGGRVEAISPGGAVLGLTPEPKLGMLEAVLHPGDAVVFYTDGVVEARSPDGEFFGEERLEALIRACAGLSARRIAERIEGEVMGFQRGDPRDDVALLVLRIEEPAGQDGGPSDSPA
jgi:sigma-B regulation protein RsbU (phosphoserine phosphatase)